MNSEVVFDLEQLAWPALLVDTHGSIHQANAAAKSVLGTVLNQERVSLSSLWATENQGTAADFLAGWWQAKPAFVTLKFKVASGATAPFTTAIFTPGDPQQKKLVLQLLDGVNGSLPMAASGDPAILKQKLDCMLQLAQTVSLDFNNALTGVLAHTSLLLGRLTRPIPGVSPCWRWKSLRRARRKSWRSSPVSAGRKK
jgi:hypothetical protein